jgi:hypothetical protein
MKLRCEIKSIELMGRKGDKKGRAAGIYVKLISCKALRLTTTRPSNTICLRSFESSDTILNLRFVFG